MANDFIMTLDSDDDVPQPKPTTSTNAKPAQSAPARKLTRKEQLLARKNQKQPKQKKGKKTVVDHSDEEDEPELQPKAGSDDEGMAQDFVFDGLGGGFVGDRRQQVWVSIAPSCAQQCGLELGQGEGSSDWLGLTPPSKFCRTLDRRT